MTSLLDVARRAAAAGGEVVARYHRDGVTMRSKGGHDLVSDADVEAEHAVAAVIRQACPGHAILGEELHRHDGTDGHLWVIDPLDGTTNFAHGLPHFAVSVACCVDGVPECGVVHDPVGGHWYVASRGGGAFHNDRPARVSAAGSLDQSLVGVGFYYDRGAMMEATLASIGDLFRRGIHGIRRFGTASLDLCMVGTGRLDAFFEYALSPWDFGAGWLFVLEAGGRVTTCDGAPLPLARTTVLASNGRLHDAMRAVVGPRAAALDGG